MSTDPHGIVTDPAIDVSALLATVSSSATVVTEHTGGGNWVAGIGTRGEWDEEQSLYRYTVNVGPFYRGDSTEPSFVGYAGDLYAVFSDGRPMVVATSADHLTSAILAALSR